MDVTAFCTWLEAREYSGAIRSSDWLFPMIETVHVLSLTIVVGSIAMMDFTLLGMASRTRPVTEVAAEVLPWTWTGFAVASISGFLLFSSAAVKYSADDPFRLKLGLLALAGINMTLFHRTSWLRAAEWNAGAPPLAARMAGGISLLLWIGIVFCGRWVGFTT